MRNTLYILLLSCIFGSGLLILTGLGLALIAHKTIIADCIEHGRLGDKVEVLVFDKATFSSLEWEDDHEFRFDGVMFDVVRMASMGDSVLVECYKDEYESHVRNTMASLLSRFVLESADGSMEPGETLCLVHIIQPVFLDTQPFPGTTISRELFREAIYLHNHYKSPFPDFDGRPPWA